MSRLFTPTPLLSTHVVDSFGCGKDSLDKFLKLHALEKQQAKLSRTYVVLNEGEVVGYYTLAHISLEQESMPKKLGRGMPRAIPAILMARFAVTQSYQGKGLGRSMLVDALQRTWAVIESGAAPVRFFVVDAIDAEAKTFYERFDLVSAPEDPLRLYLSYKTIQSLFG